jgi:hypothetical protein
VIDIEQLRAAFAEKLTRTGSIDAAFAKAVWLAYKAGLADASVDNVKEQDAPK